MKIAELANWLEQRLLALGLEDALSEAHWMLDAVGLNRLQRLQRGQEQAEISLLTQLQAWLARRSQREPLQYILGQQYFRQLCLDVNPAVLIPRPETEELVELALERLAVQAEPPLRVADIGTGSGAIALSLKYERPALEVFATDLSAAALKVARYNAQKYALEITFLQGNLLEPLKSLASQRPFDLLISNPPYIPARTLPLLAPEVRDFEPEMALTPGADALSCYRIFAAQGAALLRDGGWLVVELDAEGATATAALFERPEWRAVQLHKDLQGLPRFLSACKVEADQLEGAQDV